MAESKETGPNVIAPEDCEYYLTPGATYATRQWLEFDDGGAYFVITDDEGDELGCDLRACMHLNGRAWIVEGGDHG